MRTAEQIRKEIEQIRLRRDEVTEILENHYPKYGDSARLLDDELELLETHEALLGWVLEEKMEVEPYEPYTV